MRGLALALLMIAAPVGVWAQSAPLIDQPLPLAPNLVVRMVVYDLPPAGSGLTDTHGQAGHRHPGATYAYVVSGHVRSRLGDGADVLYGPGEAWSETPNQPHYIVNASTTEAAKVVVTFIIPKDAKQLTEPLPK
jgi:quercetin dioxygenase-like cupin family protein